MRRQPDVFPVMIQTVRGMASHRQTRESRIQQRRAWAEETHCGAEENGLRLTRYRVAVGIPVQDYLATKRWKRPLPPIRKSMLSGQVPQCVLLLPTPPGDASRELLLIIREDAYVRKGRGAPPDVSANIPSSPGQGI